jgi:hypothetical protein
VSLGNVAVKPAPASLPPRSRRLTTGLQNNLPNIKFKNFFSSKKDTDSIPRDSSTSCASDPDIHHKISPSVLTGSSIPFLPLLSIEKGSQLSSAKSEGPGMIANTGDGAEDQSDDSEGTQPDDDAAQARTDGSELTAEQIQAFNESAKMMIKHNTNAPGEDSQEEEIIGWQMRRLGLIPRVKQAFGSDESIEKEEITTSFGDPFRFRINLYDETTVVAVYPEDMTFEKVLTLMCKKYGYNYKDMTFEYGKKPNLETVDMDKKLEIYANESPLIDLWIMKKSKSYSQHSVKSPETGNEILSYQMVDGVY